MNPIPNYKEGKPLEHYAAIYRSLGAEEISKRCGLQYDGSEFTAVFFSVPIKIKFPEFAVSPELSGYEKIILLRYLIEGRLTDWHGRFLAYREVPWGGLYNQNFQGRCIARMAHSFGSDPEKWGRAMLSLGAAPVTGTSGTAFDWDIMPGLTVRYILWAGEPEDRIGPSAQILFADNIPNAFSGEDLAVAGDIAINRMKKVVCGK